MRWPLGLRRTRIPASTGAAVPLGTVLLAAVDLVVDVRVVEVTVVLLLYVGREPNYNTV